MSKILILNTGGTFNKCYDEVSGTLKINKNNKIIDKILTTAFRDNLNIKVKGILYKDSLEITNVDREELSHEIRNYEKVIIIHGTDTMDKTAKFLDKCLEDKIVILTGAMKPFSIDKLEAVSNLSLAVSQIQTITKSGIYISMHGLTKQYTKLVKNRKLGIFQCQK